MRSNFHYLSPTTLIAGLFTLAACADSSTAPPTTDLRTLQETPQDNGDGGVYTMTNGSEGNAVLAFRRTVGGSLSLIGAFTTGGRGTGGTVDPLQSQYSLVLSGHHRFLFAVNAKSNEVSAFRVRDDGSLELTDRVPSHGARPVSLAEHDRLLYVLNAETRTLSGFRVNATGQLLPVLGSTRGLAEGAVGVSTIHFSADGKWLVLTERITSRIETFAVGVDGRLRDPLVTPSSDAVPFGFDVTPRNQPVIAEAMGATPDGAVSSYRFGSDGTLDVITGSLDSGGMATCWLILSTDGRHAFVSNTASNAVGSFEVAESGTVTLLDAKAGLTGEGSAPIDLDLAADDQYLYVLEGGSGHIATFRVDPTGTLSRRPDTPAGADSSGMQGLAAW